MRWISTEYRSLTVTNAKYWTSYLDPGSFKVAFPNPENLKVAVDPDACHWQAVPGYVSVGSARFWLPGSGSKGQNINPKLKSKSELM